MFDQSPNLEKRLGLHEIVFSRRPVEPQPESSVEASAYGSGERLCIPVTRSEIPKYLRDADFSISSVNLPQRLANFSHGGVCADGAYDVRHGVGGRNVPVRTGCTSPGSWFLGSSFLERVQSPANLFIGSPSRQRRQLRRLLASDGLVNIENMRRFFFDGELVDAHSDFFFGLRRTLVLIRGLGNLLLRIAALDGLNHAAHGVELAEVVECTLLHLQRKVFYKVRSAHRINCMGYDRFLSNDLLRPQCVTRSFFCRQHHTLLVAL